MATQIEWKVGATVYVVPDDLRWRNPTTATVTKIGRKYATLSDGHNPLRADIETGRIGDSAYHYGKAWPSVDAYEASKRVQEAWLRLRLTMDNKRTPPEGVSEEDIKTAMKALNLL